MELITRPRSTSAQSITGDIHSREVDHARECVLGISTALINFTDDLLAQRVVGAVLRDSCGGFQDSMQAVELVDKYAILRGRAFGVFECAKDVEHEGREGQDVADGVAGDRDHRRDELERLSC